MTTEIKFKNKKLEKEYQENIDEIARVMGKTMAKFLTRFLKDYRAYKRGEWD